MMKLGMVIVKFLVMTGYKPIEWFAFNHKDLVVKIQKVTQER